NLLCAAETQSKELPGRVPMRLFNVDHLGYSFVVDGAPRSPGVSGRLYALDGKTLKGKSLHEINQLLLGPSGTSVEVGYLDYTDNVRKATVLREPLKKGGTEVLADLGRVSPSFDWSIDGPGDNNEYWESQNLDLFVRAKNNIALRK